MKAKGSEFVAVCLMGKILHRRAVNREGLSRLTTWEHYLPRNTNAKDGSRIGPPVKKRPIGYSDTPSPGVKKLKMGSPAKVSATQNQLRVCLLVVE